MKQHTQLETTLWHCESCQAWWSSGGNMDAAALIQDANSLISLMARDDYHVWHKMTTNVTCPRCGQPAIPFLQTHVLEQEDRFPQYPHEPYLKAA
jgi:ribosomal protein L37AE/L43A